MVEKLVERGCSRELLGEPIIKHPNTKCQFVTPCCYFAPLSLYPTIVITTSLYSSFNEHVALL